MSISLKELEQIKDMTLVYGLVDPRNNLVKYVGKTIRGIARVKLHVQNHGNPNNPKNLWVKELFDEGHLPEFIIFETPTIEDLTERELHYINKHRDTILNKQGLGSNIQSKAPFSKERPYTIEAVDIDENLIVLGEYDTLGVV